ncbi:MAG: hypothetical protein JKY48_18980 [Flavobacteriales bacterium]|nr:hypothetical protein [Flavobacteriales bacterium]
MKISSFAKTRKIKPFSFTPRYYNQEKEEFQQRYADIEAKINGTTSSSPSLTGFKDKWKQKKNTSNFEKKSNIRLAIIMASLFALCYWVLFS